MSPYPLGVQVTTTTVFTGPTSQTQPSPPPTANVPVAPIVAGSCAGIFLAVVLVLAWKWWGRTIRIQQRKQLDKRRAAQAVIAYRRSVVDGPRSRSTSISYPRRSGRPYPASLNKSEPKVKFAPLDSSSRSLEEKPPLPSPPLQPAIHNSTSHLRPPVRHHAKISKPPPYARSRNLQHLPRPSPLAPTTFRRTHAPNHSSSSSTSTAPLLPSSPTSDPASPQTPPVNEPFRRERLPSEDRALDAAARLSKFSQSSAASEYSQASDPRQRWSWRRLITGPGLSLAQLGIGTGKERLSAGSSALDYWEEENPDVPIGYAYTGEEVFPSHLPPQSLQTERSDGGAETVYPQEYFTYCEEDDHGS